MSRNKRDKRARSNRDVQRFFELRERNRAEDELLANLNNFYHGDEDDELLNGVYQNYLINLGQRSINEHNYLAQVSE